MRVLHYIRGHDPRTWPRRWLLAAMRAGGDHYLQEGLAEQRAPFRLDQVWYARTCPVAAVEVEVG